jgi:flagellar protein FliS
MTRRFFGANRLNDVDIVNEVMGLFLEVKAGWEGIRESYLDMSSQGKFTAAQASGVLSV